MKSLLSAVVNFGTITLAQVATNPDYNIRGSLENLIISATFDDAVALVESGTVAAALGPEPSFAYYLLQPPCDLIIVGTMSYSNYWGLALSPSMPPTYASVSMSHGRTRTLLCFISPLSPALP